MTGFTEGFSHSSVSSSEIIENPMPNPLLIGESAGRIREAITDTLQEIPSKVGEFITDTGDAFKKAVNALIVPNEVTERWPNFPLIPYDPIIDANPTSPVMCELLRLLLSVYESSGKEADNGDASDAKFVDSTENVSPGSAAGTAHAVTSVGKKLADEQILSARQGHGYLAEQVNNAEDLWRGHDAKIVGGDLAKDGADRLVDGTFIQTKYHKTADGTIRSCFRDNGTGDFRYFSSDGKPMQIEVPKDQYADAVKLVQEKIKDGRIPGVSDPEMAAGIVREGHYTYKEVVNIARAGNIDSLKFDAKNGLIISTGAMTISATITFAYSLWNGDDVQTALLKALKVGCETGLVSFMVSVIASQIQKCGINLVKDWHVPMNKLASSTLSAAKNEIAKTGGTVLGIDMSKYALSNAAKKLLQGNVIAGTLTTVILSGSDFMKLYSGEISKATCFRNVAKNAAGVTGGTAGWTAGATVGAEIGAAVGSVIPVAGTVIGGGAGALIGGMAGAIAGDLLAREAADAVLDTLVAEDDIGTRKIFASVQDEIGALSSEIPITEKEGMEIINRINASLDDSMLASLKSNDSPNAAIHEFTERIFDDVISERAHIYPPSEEDMRTMAFSIMNAVPAAA